MSEERKAVEERGDVEESERERDKERGSFSFQELFSMLCGQERRMEK